MKKIKTSSIIFIFLSVITFLSIASYHFSDVFYPHDSIKNIMGLIGVYISSFMLNRFGLFAYYLPIFLLLSSFSYNKSKAKFTRGVIFGVLVMFFGDVLLYAVYGANRDHLIMNGYFNCGVFGYIFGDTFGYLLGNVGIFIIIIPIWMLTLYFSLMEFFNFLVKEIEGYDFSNISLLKIRQKTDREHKSSLIKQFVDKKIYDKTNFSHIIKTEDKGDSNSSVKENGFNGIKDSEDGNKKQEDKKIDDNNDDIGDIEHEQSKVENLDATSQDNEEDNTHKLKDVPQPSLEKTDENDIDKIPQVVDLDSKEDNNIKPTIDKEFVNKKIITQSQDVNSDNTQDEYSFPPLTLLSEPISIHTSIQEDEIYASAKILKEKLKNFGVDGDVVNVRPGPVVTMYEFRPKSGIKISKISNLYNDLAMAMKAMSVRIIAPIPGKAVVGIEISNQKRETVFMKDILESRTFAQSKSKLTLALGKDIVGNPFVADLSKMPHLLIAGATGSGKSVSVNTMILSILYKSTPDDIRFVMIDPKMLELSVYDGIPHMLMPVVVDPKEASGSLAALVGEMETRYRMMSEVGVRNIDGFNAKAENGEIDYSKLPYIVVVIDELADLMMVSGKKVEIYIARLAQMARAAGIHMIVATQRPSVDVLTGLIKANFPARISFKVSSKIDSRTILDMQGAEALLGRGDMLFMQPGSHSLARIHGAFVSDDEIKNVTDFVKAQGSPQYNEELISATKEAIGETQSDDIETDEMFEDALRIIKEGGNPTISYIQRRLKIGYNRAARIIEQMEKKGILSKPDERNRREILI